MTCYLKCTYFVTKYKNYSTKLFTKKMITGDVEKNFQEGLCPIKHHILLGTLEMSLQQLIQPSQKWQDNQLGLPPKLQNLAFCTDFLSRYVSKSKFLPKENRPSHSFCLCQEQAQLVFPHQPKIAHNSSYAHIHHVGSEGIDGDKQECLSVKLPA